MPTATIADFVGVLHALPLLDAAQQKQLSALREQCTDIKTLGQELIRHGVLTTFQANQIARGRGTDLVLDQYVLVDLLGQGGMGAVYKARQQRMERFVAVKLIRREAVHAPGAVERFQREAKAAAKLSHPNIVTVFDTNQTNGVPFLVMEYLEGSDLAKLVKDRGPLPVGFACDCIRQAALGLQHAHEQGLIHRDIKPHNLMLTKQGVVKVMDLGLARVRTEAGAAGVGLTATGVVMGTPDYIAPEQAMNSKGVDIRADIYSLGCSLYHLLTGRPPFAGETVTEKLVKHQLEDPAPIEQLRPGLPDGLPAVIRKMMAKQPAQRYQTPADVAQALDVFGKKTPGDSAAWPTAGSAKAVQTGPVPPTVSVQVAAATLETRHDSLRDLQETKLTTVGGRPRPGRRVALVVLVGLAAVVLLAAVAVPLFLFSSPKPVPTKVAVVRGPTSGEQIPTSTPTTPVDTRFAPLPGKEYVTNSIGLRLVKIHAGNFKMGASVFDPLKQPGDAQHQVTLTKPFYLGVFVVTQEEYFDVVGTNPSGFRVGGLDGTAVQEMETQRFPVEHVSWEDAQAFCKKLSALPDEKKAGRVYCLPTEAEWEYACRAGTTTSFSFGKECNGTQANCNGTKPYGTDIQGPYLQRTCPVGSYAPNAFGLYDMHGNVFEWCDDWWVVQTNAPATDPKGVDNLNGRVLRGGSWYYPPVACRSANRHRSQPKAHDNNIGFRVAFRLE